jgi:hypothetical protein
MLQSLLYILRKLAKENQTQIIAKAVKTHFVQDLLKQTKIDLSIELGSILNTERQMRMSRQRTA